MAALQQGPASPKALRPWLRVVARRRAIDTVRRRVARRSRETGCRRGGQSPSTLSVIARVERSRLLIDAVMELPGPYREVVLLRYFDGKPPRDIASELGVPTETVRTRLRRGLGDLRRRLDATLGGERGAWIGVLTPLAISPGVTIPATLILGGLTVKKIALAVVVAAVALVGWQIVERIESKPEESTGQDSSDLLATRPVLTGKTTETAEAAPLPAGRGTISGVVRRGGSPTRARVEIRRVAWQTTLPERWGLDSHRHVRPVDLDAPAGRTVVAGDDGTFSCEGLGAHEYEVRAVVADGAWAYAYVTIGPDALHAEADIFIHGGTEAIEGRAVYADGAPFRGLVFVDRSNTSHMVWWRGVDTLACVETDAKGRFAIEALPVGDLLWLRAVAVGRLAAVRGIVLPRRGDLVFVVDPALRSVRGRVLADADGAPIEGALVTGSGGVQELSALHTTSTTDAHGRFVVRVGRGQASVCVRKTGYVAAPLRLAKGGPTETDIRLKRCGSLTGVVLDREDDRPVPGISVYATGIARGYATNEHWHAKTGDDGRFSFPECPSGLVGVFAFGHAGVSSALGQWRAGGPSWSEGSATISVAVQVSAGGLRDVELWVVSPGRIEGTLRGVHGEVVAGGRIAAEVQGSPLSSHWRSSPLRRYFHVTSGPDGAFEFPVLPTGVHVGLTAVADGYPLLQTAPVLIRHGGPRIVDLQLEAGRMVDLAVIDRQTGDPVPGATVRLYRVPRPGSLYGFPGRWTTGPQGRARVGPIPPGEVALWVRAAGYVQINQRPDATIRADQEGPIALTLPLAPGLIIAGRLSTAEDLPLDGVELEFVHLGTPDPDTGRRVHSSIIHSGPACVGGDGSFRIAGLVPGTYHLRAVLRFGDRVLAATKSVEAGAQHVGLDLIDHAGTGWGLRIKDREGRPIPQGSVRIQYIRDGAPGSIAMISFHEYPIFFDWRIQARDQPIWIEIWDLKDETGQPLPIGASLHGPFEPRPGLLDIRLGEETRIEGRVVDVHGEPVRGVAVSASPDVPFLSSVVGGDMPHGTGVTADDGTFRIDRLGTMAYRLIVDAPKTYARPEPIEVLARARGVQITLRDAVAITLAIVDEGGAELSGAHIRYRVAVVDLDPSYAPERDVDRWWNEHLRPAVPSVDGHFQLEGLDPEAEYELYVDPPPDHTDLRPLHLARWVPKLGTVLTMEKP